MQISHKTWKKPGYFCGMRIPHHAAPFHITPRAAALMPHDTAFMPQLLLQIPH
jgi:hypothetical protein